MLNAKKKLKNMKCKHKEAYWYCKLNNRESVNEDGWYCTDCKKELGFRPDLDKKQIHLKVRNILDDMVDAGILYVSNGTEGDCIMENVACYCQRTGFYDKYTIIRQIILDPNIDVDGHAKYWKEKAKEGFSID